MKRIPRVLSIAGTDPTGGAGIQADLKSIAANHGYAMAVVTALVAQNTHGVRSVFAPPVTFLTEQLLAVSDDVTIDAVKIGMLLNTDIVMTVKEWLQLVRPPGVVLDPVMVATSGDRLLNKETEAAVFELLELADLVTPNLPELARLVGEPQAKTWEQAVQQGRQLADRTGTLVLVKGGHFTDDTVRDALVNSDGVVAQAESPRVATANTHGTGCSLSSALATNYARFGDWSTALRVSKQWITESLKEADTLDVGTGNGPISHFASLWKKDECND